MLRRSSSFRPFELRGRGTIAAIVLIFAVGSTLSSAISVWATGRSKHRATVLQVAARQRTLAERYVEELLLVKAGSRTDPATTAATLTRSARALLDGGKAPAVAGDDDEAVLPPTRDRVVRSELLQELRLVHDLTAAGTAFLADRPLSAVRMTAGERMTQTQPVERLRVLAALTSNVSLNTARTIASKSDHNVAAAVTLEIGLGIGGIVVSVLLAWALVTATRRQTAHFRSLVTSSTDLVTVLSGERCRYASKSLVTMLGRQESELVDRGFFSFVHEDDRPRLLAAVADGETRQLTIRVRNGAGVWRHLDAHLTNLSNDRNVRGVVVNARDVTERIELEQELTRQAQRDSFGSQLVEAFEMADDEDAAYAVVTRGMSEISNDAPMELLLSDSSRAHLERVAQHATAGAPGCPVESPYACVAVRRGNPAVFDSSEALNACPKLRARATGPCSAVCVPVSFMGRSLGVLHATGPEHTPLRTDEIARLTTLAGQAGARIGTVRAFEKTQLQASTDSLTGLINRRSLENEVRILMRQKTQFALAIADLDLFKQLNDTHGHEAGDRSLLLFANTLRRVMRDVDLIARWGGEEFVIVMPGADCETAVNVLTRVRERLAAQNGAGHPTFTASFGIADSSMATSLDRLITLADAALYISKKSGRDRLTVADALDLETPRSHDGLNGLAIADLHRDD